MRRIPDDLVKAVVFLYPSSDEAVTGTGYGGSGFLIGMTAENKLAPDHAETSALVNPVHAYVVTNAHVAATCAYVRTSHPLAPIYFVESWTNHPDGDDVAVAHLGILGLDTIGLGKIVHRSFFMTPEAFEGNEIGPGDQAFMIGRFTGVDERERNHPTVRAGTLSMVATMPVVNKQWGGIHQESFFVEVNSKAGYSGSPVYIEIPPPSLVPAAQGAYPADRGAYIGLLGITWGLWRGYVPLLDPDTHELIPEGWVVHESSGIEMVIPAWRIMDLLTEEDVVERREKYAADAEQERRRLKPDAVATDVTPGLPASARPA